MYSNNAPAVGTNEVANIHNKTLCELCRICANIPTAFSYDVKTYSGLVHTAFHIDVTSEDIYKLRTLQLYSLNSLNLGLN